MIKITKDNVAAIVAEAEAAAYREGKEYLEKYGEGMFNCGFAWVVIKPARGVLATYLKDTKKGSKHYQGGLCVWQPSGLPVQDRDVHRAGAKAYASVLQEYGINADYDFRLD